MVPIVGLVGERDSVPSNCSNLYDRFPYRSNTMRSWVTQWMLFNFSIIAVTFSGVYVYVYVFVNVYVYIYLNIYVLIQYIYTYVPIPILGPIHVCTIGHTYTNTYT
jgi:hypothetical protein